VEPIKKEAFLEYCHVDLRFVFLFIIERVGAHAKVAHVPTVVESCSAGAWSCGLCPEYFDCGETPAFCLAGKK
jgi:hypothetical protein